MRLLCTYKRFHAPITCMKCRCDAHVMRCGRLGPVKFVRHLRCAFLVMRMRCADGALKRFKRIISASQAHYMRVFNAASCGCEVLLQRCV